MRFGISKRILLCLFTVIFFCSASLPNTCVAQEAEDPCKSLMTPSLIMQHYSEGNYKETFPCLVRMIETGDYKKNTKVWTDHIFPVINHYFLNELDKEGQYDLGAILWQIMIGAGDEAAAKAVSDYKWSNRIEAKVSAELKRFNEPTGIKLNPPKPTVGRQKQIKIDVIYHNRAEIPLSSVTPNISSEVTPPGKATCTVEDNKVVVTGLKAGEKPGTLTVSDKELGLVTKAPLTVTGRMSPLWLVGGFAATGGTAAAATAADDGKALWIVCGVAAAATGFLLFKYIRGEGVPFLSKADSDLSDNHLAFCFVPGFRSLEFKVRF